MNGNNVIGVFTGLSSSSYEYLASLMAPYKQGFALRIGSILLVQGMDGDVVARVVDYQPRGELTSAMGMKWLSRTVSQGSIDDIGSDIKQHHIMYDVRIKILGRLEGGKFSPGLSKIPHITSKVSIPDLNETRAIIQQAMDAQSGGSVIGKYELEPEVDIIFDQNELSSKRTFIFARAGFGKSNLMKVLCSEWRASNGGLLVFDSDGEYATTDRKGRPGVMDRREAILITNQRVDPELKNVYGTAKVNIGRLPHGLVIPLLVNPDKHTNIFFHKLMAMPSANWPKLVKLLGRDGWNASVEEVGSLVVGGKAAMTHDEARPILNNLVRPIQDMHSDASDVIRVITKALKDGRVVIFDTSRIGQAIARWTSSIIINHIFNENKDNFIKHGGERLIRATFVLEEAHTILSERARDSAAFVELAKEGRKYGLGGIFITQQPGSIPAEIVSQGDNFFIFHMLSISDLTALSKSNAHYSSDVVTQILNEPIPGKCYVWTSRQPFVVPTRILSFDGGEFAKPHQSTAIQQKFPILDDILGEIKLDMDNPIVNSIRRKCIEVEEQGETLDDRGRTRLLYQKLDETERSYMDKRGCLQPSNIPGSGFFAVTFASYDMLLRDGYV